MPHFTLIIAVLLILPSFKAIADVDGFAHRWLSGADSTGSWVRQPAEVILTPGSDHVRLLPAHSALRLEGEGIEPKEFSAWLDDGNGLAVSEPWFRLDKSALGLDLREIQKPMLLRLTRSPHAQGDVRMRVSLWRPDPLPAPPLYRNEILLPLEEVTIVGNHPPQRENYGFLPSGVEVERSIKGPVRIQLESRLRWPKRLPGLEAYHRLSFTLDKDAPVHLESRPGLESDAYWVDGNDGVLLGSRESFYLDIPPGGHVIRLASNHETYLRLTGRDGSDLLLPSLNGMTLEKEVVPKTVSAQGRRDDPDELARTASQLTQDPEFFLDIPSGSHDIRLASNHGTSLRLTGRDGSDLQLPSLNGMTLEKDVVPKTVSGEVQRGDPAELARMAFRLMQDPNQPEGALEASALLRRASAVYPWSAGELGRLAQRVMYRGTHYRDLFPAPVPAEEVTHAYFLPRLLRLPEDDSSRPRIDETRLAQALDQIPSGRFVVLREGGELTYHLPERHAESRIRLAVVRDGVTQPVTLNLTFDDKTERLLNLLEADRPDPPAAVFQTTVAEVALERIGGDFDHALFQYRHPPGKRILAGVVEWPLPPSVRTIRLISPQGAPPLRAALQLRVAAPVSLDEGEYHAKLADLGGADTLWQRFAARQPFNGRMESHFRPFFRWLEAERQRFEHNVVPFKGQGGASGDALERAEQAASLGDWTNALGDWRRVLSFKPNDRTAWRGVWLSLEKLEEWPLRERMLKGLALFGQDNALSEEAREKLVEHYRSHDALKDLLTLFAWDAERRRDIFSVNRLAAALAEAGLDKLAFQAALLPPTAQRDHALVAGLALNEAWSLTFDEALAFLPGNERLLWSQRADWHARGGGVAPPGLTDWQSLPGLITRFQKSHRYRVESTGAVLTLYEGTATHPVTLETEGPARIRLAMRPAHAVREEGRKNGWIELRLDGMTVRHWAVRENPISTGLVPEIDAQPLPGVVTERELVIPKGRHLLEIASNDFPVLVEARMARPRFGVIREEAAEIFKETSPPDFQALERLAWEMETRLDQREALLVKAESLAGQSPMARSLLRFIRQWRSWEPVRTVESSAGVRWLEMDRLIPEDPDMRIRALLLSPGDPHGRLLVNTSPLVMATHSNRSWRMVVGLTLQSAPFFPLAPLAVALRQTGVPDRLITLDANTHSIRIPLLLEPGEQSVSLALPEPMAGLYVRAELLDEQGHPMPWNATQDRERLFHAATRESPVLLHVEGPTLMRVDEYRDGRTVSEYRSITAGWNTIKLFPTHNQGTAYYRIFTQQVTTTPYIAAQLPDPVRPKLPAIIDFPPDFPALPTSPSSPWDLHMDGTWSLSMRRETRRDSGDDAGSGGKERFSQLEIHHRRVDPEDDQYDRWSALWRQRDKGNPTLGISWRREDRDDEFPVNWWGEGTIYSQDVDGEGVELAATVRGGVSRIDHLGEKLENDADLSVFARYLTMENDRRTTTGTLDRDVFTDYARDHLHGATLSDTLRYRPWLDTIVSMKIWSGFNENLTVDHVGFMPQWQQMVGDGRLRLRWNQQRSLKDSDRQQEMTRHGPEILLSLDHWLPQGDRLEGSLQLRRELSTDETIGFVGFSWHFDDDRLRRFSPGERPFSDLRRLRWPVRGEGETP